MATSATNSTIKRHTAKKLRPAATCAAQMQDSLSQNGTSRVATTCIQSGGAIPGSAPMLKTLLLSATVVGAGVIGASAQPATTPPGGSVSAATHCKDASGQVKMKTAGNTPGAPTAGSSAGKSGGAAERPAGAAPPASGSSGTSGSASGMSGSTSGSATAALPNC
jgi:hypothetical protein